MKSSLTYKLLGGYVAVMMLLLLSKYFLDSINFDEALSALINHLIYKLVGF